MIWNGSRTIIIPSNKYKQWHEQESWNVRSQKPIKGIKRCKITYQFYTNDKRRRDASNLIESINDLLVDNGVLVDDNWFVIEEMHILPVVYDKDVKPHVDVEIYPLANSDN